MAGTEKENLTKEQGFQKILENFDWSVLWEEEKPSDLMRFLPLISAVLTLITLLVVIFKK